MKEIKETDMTMQQEPIQENKMGVLPIRPLLLGMAWPAILSMTISALYNIVDSYFVAKLSEDAMTALSLVYPAQNLLTAVAVGFGVGVNAMISFYLGAQNQEKADKTATQGMVLGVLHGVLLMVLFLCGMNLFLGMFTKSDTVRALGMEYSNVVFLFSAIVTGGITLEKIFQAVGRMRATMVSMIAGFVTNIVLDPLLIFGIGPFPKMGVQGAALATVIARYIEALIVIIWAHMHRAKNRYLEGAYTGFGIPFAELKAILVKGFPLMMNEVMWAAGMTTVTQCYSVRGLDVVAGLNIASTITNLFNIVYLQLGSCISIVVGQYLGAGKLEEAKDADNKMIIFSVFCCVIMAALMFVVGGFFPGIYNTSDEIKGLATQFIAVSAIIMPFCAFSHASYFTLRSGGKTVVTFLFDSVFTWVIVVPAAYLLAHFTGLGIVSIYFLVQGTELIKVIIGYLMVKSNVWVVQMV